MKSANFGSTSPLDQHEEYLSLLRALPFFVNLEHITLTEETIESLFEPKVADDVATLQEALRMAAPSISGLTIYTSDPTAFEYLLPMFVNLRRFAWPVTHEDDWTRILPAVQVLGRCNLLEHLDLECAEEELFTLLLSEGVDSRAWPSLLSLKLHLEDYEAGDRIGMAAWRFIQSFNNTLESITLTLGAHLSDDLIAESDTSPHAFPNLRLLTIKSAYHSMDFIPLLKLFSASRIRHLVLLPYGNGMDDDSPDSLPSTALFETVLRLFPHHLQSVRLEYNHVVPGIHHLRSITPALASLASARNISLTLGPSYDVYLYRTLLAKNGPLPPSDLDDNCDEVGKVLRYALRQTEALRAAGDGHAVDRLREAAEPLKASMLRGLD